MPGMVLAWGGEKKGVGAAVFLGVVDSVDRSVDGGINTIRGQYLQPQVDGSFIGVWTRSLLASTGKAWVFTVLPANPAKKKTKDTILASDVMALVDWVDADGQLLAAGQPWTDTAQLTAGEWSTLEENLMELYGGK